MKCFVVLFDVIRSSAVADRESLTRRMEEASRICNEKYSSHLAGVFEITKGDEIAGVLNSAAPLFSIYRDIQEVLQPEGVRCAVAWGDITAGLNSRRSSIMDGPGFYRANEIMLQLKKLQLFWRIFSDGGVIDEALNALVNLYFLEREKLTPLQRRVYDLYLILGNQQQVAHRLNRTQQQISATLKSIRWRVLKGAEEAIGLLLLELDKRIKGERDQKT
jgi:hypothetical protein